MTGVELIAKEREEQITKHGYTAENDAVYLNNQIIDAALFYLTKKNDKSSFWTDEAAKTLDKKSDVERLVIAGALIAAELDRLNNLAE